MFHEEDWKILMETPEERSERYRRYAASMRGQGRWYKGSTPMKRFIAGSLVVAVLAGLVGYFLL